MLSQTVIRPARPEDSEAIACLMREGVSDQVRRITIMGSPQLGRYIADEITEKRGDEYVVGMMQGQVIGMSSWRHMGAMLQLNHLYLASDAQGQGLGPTLILDGLQRVRRLEEDQLSVDVFYDNPRARAWYQSWGMSPTHQVQWIQVPLQLSEFLEPLWWTVSGFAESQESYLRYGFSLVTLTTNSASYCVGRLGRDLFRVTTGAILRDSAALQGLVQLDPNRHLLCIVSKDERAELAPGVGTCVAESERLVSSCAAVRELLASSLAQRPRRCQSIPSRL